MKLHWRSLSPQRETFSFSCVTRNEKGWRVLPLQYRLYDWKRWKYISNSLPSSLLPLSARQAVLSGGRSHGAGRRRFFGNWEHLWVPLLASHSSLALLSPPWLSASLYMWEGRWGSRITFSFHYMDEEPLTHSTCHCAHLLDYWAVWITMKAQSFIVNMVSVT